MIASSVLLLFLATSAAQATEEVPTPRFLLGDGLRYENAVLPLRVAADLVAIPAGIPHWEEEDWAWAITFGAPTVALMLPLEHPNDAHVQAWVRSQLGPKRLVWTPLGEVAMWSGLWGTAAGFLAYGWWANEPRYVEQFSLMLEAFSVTQLYHVGFKLLLGREGPNDGEGLGVIHGPPGFFRLFPAGTPSGHVASLYAMVGSLDGYWANPWLSAAVHLFALSFATTVVLDNYHFVSDALWGAGMGYFIGRWVVRHRAGPKRAGPLPSNVAIVPARNGLAVQVVF